MIILTIGIGNSGKSTWAREMTDSDSNVTEVNRDDIRIELFCDGKRSLYHTYKFSKTREAKVTEVALSRVKAAVADGMDVIISDTNLNGKTRSFWKSFCEDNNVEYREKVFDIEPHLCLSRNGKRDITLPKRVILQQYDSYRKFKGMLHYSGTAGKPDAVIFDADGTLFDMGGRRGPFEYDKVHLDSPRDNVMNILKMYSEAGYKILIVTGREFSCFEATLKSLSDNGADIEDLFMREVGDKRSDPEVKEEIFWKRIADKYNVKLCFDDRTRMVDRWRAMGLECHQVQAGDF